MAENFSKLNLIVSKLTQVRYFCTDRLKNKINEIFEKHMCCICEFQIDNNYEM